MTNYYSNDDFDIIMHTSPLLGTCTAMEPGTQAVFLTGGSVVDTQFQGIVEILPLFSDSNNARNNRRGLQWESRTGFAFRRMLPAPRRCKEHWILRVYWLGRLL